MEPKRFYCRLQAWHPGKHVAKGNYAWESGDRMARQMKKRCPR